MTRHTRAPRALLAATALALSGLVAAGCAISTDAAARPAGAQDPLNVLNTPESVPANLSAGKGPSVRYTIFYISNGLLSPVSRTIRKSTSPTDAIDAALTLLSTKPTNAEALKGIITYFSPLERTAPFVVSFTGGLATIELDNSFNVVSATALAYAMGQIIYTVTDVPNVTVTGVAFQLNGSPFAGYSPSGRIIQPPLTRADYAAIAGGAR